MRDVASQIRNGRKGGLARTRLYGNPGTPEGRRKGGLRSLKTHKRKKTGFKLLHEVAVPKNSTTLAELLGILAGDGHISEYQASVTTNSETDLEHALFVKSLFERVFKIPASLSKRKRQKAVVVVLSSKAACQILVSKGMVAGHKITGGLRIPAWVRREGPFLRAFIRGLFDTDGCVYTDRHIIKGRLYENIGMAFTNRSLPLLQDFKDTLESLNFHPTQKTKYTVFLRRKEEIRRYFELIGSSNPKHLKKVRSHLS